MRLRRHGRARADAAETGPRSEGGTAVAQSPDVNADRDEGDEYGLDESLPPLVQAAERGDLDTVRALLAEGNAVDEATADGWTALHAAAVRDHPAIVRLLLDAG